MQSTYLLSRCALVLCVMLLGGLQVTHAQVGINTTSPNGILDINSSTTGFVLPRVALTATNVAAPVTNPQGGALAIGTLIYNTATTNTGSNDVTPGFYVWDGSSWFAEFRRKQVELFESSTFIRSVSTGGFSNISGLINRTFTANYNGKYKIEVAVNFGGGGARVPNGSASQGNLNVAAQTGTFRFTLDGTDYDIPAYAYSTAYNGSVGATNYFAIWQEHRMVMYVDYTAGDVLNFNLSFDQDNSPEFNNNGNSGDGRGYIAYDIPCTVEITYMGN